MLVSMRKRALTLLEVLIGLSLAGVLLTTLFSFYFQIFHTKIDLQKAKQVVEARAWTQQRLVQAFGRVVAEVEEGGLVFYTTVHPEALGPALVFYYDNGVDRDLNYCGEKKAMLYLNQKKQLTLLTWPKRREVLLENAASLRFSFYDLKQREWKEAWAREGEKLPAIIKMEIALSKAKQPSEFAFFLPDIARKISYKRR
jgi:type II secretory pathway pseudopilin PulG